MRGRRRSVLELRERQIASPSIDAIVIVHAVVCPGCQDFAAENVLRGRRDERTGRARILDRIFA